jgi:hypothetical protein
MSNEWKIWAPRNPILPRQIQYVPGFLKVKLPWDILLSAIDVIVSILAGSGLYGLLPGEVESEFSLAHSFSAAE